MTFENARRWLILYTLYMVGSFLLFFVVAPAFGYPLEQTEALRILEIIAPVFLGYLGTATQFLFHAGELPQAPNVDAHLLKLLVRGPAILFGFVSAATVFAFGYANRRGGTGMTPDTLGLVFTLELGLLTVSTSVIVANLFPAGGRARQQQNPPDGTIRD